MNAIAVTAVPVVRPKVCRSPTPPAVLQAAIKWRLVWRLAPRLLERWSEAGHLNEINAAVSAMTKKVCGLLMWHAPGA